MSAATTNRRSALALGGESAEELDALQNREKLRHDPTYANSVHRLWSIFDKDESGHVHKSSYIKGLSRFCQVLMPTLPRDEAVQLAANDWVEDVGDFSTNGSTMDFDGFYMAISELTDLWCPVAEIAEYTAFVDSLFKRTTVKIVHSADGEVVKRELAKSEYVFVEDVSDEDKQQRMKEQEELKEKEDQQVAAIRMQAVQRGRTSRKVARDKWLSSLAAQCNPAGLDLRRRCTKRRERQEQEQEIERQEEEKAAKRMQSITRGRLAREKVKLKKVQRKYSKLIPLGMDLRRPSSKKLQVKEDEEKSALLMQGLARQKYARKRVEERKKEIEQEEKSALLMQGLVRQKNARQKVQKIREDRAEINENVQNIQSLSIGTYHEFVDYDNDEEEETMNGFVTYQWAEPEEIVKMQEQSLMAKPPILLKGQSVSSMWEMPKSELFVENNHPLIKGRHHSHLRALQNEALREKEEEHRSEMKLVPSAPTPLNPLGLDLRRPSHKKKYRAKPHHHKNKFKCTSRCIGRLSSLKQYSLERHVLLYGSGTKNKRTPIIMPITSPSKTKEGILPEAAIVDKYAIAPAGNAINCVKLDSRRTIILGLNSSDELSVDASIASRMNDATATIGVQRGVWVVGRLDDVNERVAESLSVEMSLDLITPKVLVENAIKEYFAYNQRKKIAAEAAAAIAAEAEDGESSSEAAAQSPLAENNEDEKESLAVSVGRRMLNGQSVSPSDIDKLMMNAVVSSSCNGTRGYALAGYPRTKEDSKTLHAALQSTPADAGFAPENIVILDCDDDSYALRQSGLMYDLPSGSRTASVDRKSRSYKISEERKRLVSEARSLRIKEMKEEEEEDAEPVDYETMSLEQLGIDDLELPEMPTKSEMYGGDMPLVLPIDAKASKTSKIDVLPLDKEEHELAYSSVHHVDATQPFTDVLQNVLLSIGGGPIMQQPIVPTQFPALPEELKHPEVEVEEPTEAEPTEDGEEGEIKEVQEVKEVTKPPNPPLTKDQIQYLLYNNDIQVVAAPKPEGIEEEEEEDESKEPTPVGRFLNDTGNPDLLPPSRRFSWYRHYCPVSLVKESKLVYGLPEYSIMVSGKVYVMSSKETYDEFQSRSYFYIAARPTLPTTRTACVISFNYSNNAARHASAVICKKYGLRLLSAEDSVTDLARGPNGVEAEKLAQHMMSRVNENKEKGWIMEGCPLNTTHVAPLMKEGFQPDVVVVFPPKEEGDDDNEVPTTNTATSESESESVISESKLVDPTASLAAYAEDYPNLIALMKENGLNVVEVPHSCIIKNNSTPSVYGNIDDMIGWIDQSVNPMKQRADPVPPMDENPLNLSSCTGIYCPVSLKNGTVAQGKEDLFTFLDGAKYNFVDTRAKEQFDASPWLYVKSVQSSNGSIDPASTSPPLRVMIVGAKGASRKEIVNSVSSTCNLNIICLDDDEEYVNTMKKLMTPPPPIINEDGEEEEQELLEIPPPENYVLPILERLLVKNSNNGTVIDGNPAIFTPEVVNWMIKNRYHPSAVINCSLDAQLVVDRRMKNEFKWSPPPLPEPKVSTGEEDEDEEEEEDLPPPPTKEELEEMEEEARNELAAKIMEETENSIAACETTVESLASFDVAALNTSIAVGLRLACSRVTSTIKKHTTNVQENLSKNAVVPLSPLVSEEGEEDEIDRDEVNTAKETSRIVSLKLIQSGCKSLSRFGTRDPVHFCETKGESGSENEMGYAVAHRHQIYFLDSASNRSKFINNPMLYLNNPITKGTYASPFPLSRSTISVCIVGSPFCGKTTVAKKLCNDTGAIYLNPENVLQWALLPSNLASLPCCQRVRDQMTAGKSIQSPRGEGGMSDLLLQCLSARMNRFDVKANGYVLDDFPSNVNEATAMSLNNDLRPSVIFSMEGMSPKETLIRAKKVFLEKKNVEPTKETKWRHKTLKRLQTWYNDKEIIKATISQSYLNIKTIVVKDQSSKWSLSNCAHSVVRKLRRKTSAHMTALAHHTPAPLDGITMHCNHLMSRRGHLGGYCPVQLKDANRLVATMNGSINQRQFGTIYQGRVYSCSNLESLDTFNSNPIKYINNQELPKNLPLVVPLGAHLREKIATLAFGGYCPVTFYEGKGSRDWSSIVEADPICVVKYKSVFYGFQSVSKRTKFMETPEKYCNQTLPLKLPPKMKTKSMDELKRGGLHGVLAVVEQSLSVATQEALIKLGNNRLKFPSLSVTETASKFFGLFLKSINPSCKSNSLKQRYELKLQEFIKECQLVDFLNDNQEVMNSSTPRRGVAGIKGLRSMSDDQKKSMEEYLINARKFEMLCGEKSEQLYERYMRDV